MINGVALAWDGATLVVVLAGAFYLDSLRRAFRGGSYGKEFKYCEAGAGVLAIGFSARVVLDFFNVSTTAYGISVRDPAIIIGFALVAFGMRESTKFWKITMRGKTG